MALPPYKSLIFLYVIFIICNEVVQRNALIYNRDQVSLQKIQHIHQHYQ